MTESKQDSTIEITLQERDGIFTVAASGIGITVSAERRDDALQAFAAELGRVQAVMAEHGFRVRSTIASSREGTKTDASPEPEVAARRALPRKLSVFWQCVIFTLLVLLGINQLVLVPALDRMEKVAFYAFGEGGRNVGVRQMGRVAIDRVIDLARATEEITSERREELRRALRTISKNSRPMIEALMSEEPVGDSEKKGATPHESNGKAP